MTTIYFNSKISSTKPFEKAKYKGEVSFIRNPQRKTYDEAMNEIIYEYQGEKCFIDYINEVASCESAYKASLMPQNNGISILEIENIEVL